MFASPRGGGNDDRRPQGVGPSKQGPNHDLQAEEAMSEAPCPHCGKRLKDLHERFCDWEEGDIDDECGHCERPIVINRQISDDYEIRKPEAQS